MIRVVLVLLLIAVPAHGEIMRNLYEARVEVGNRGAAELDRGARAALEEVVVRVSGRQDAPQTPALRPALVSARNLLQKYSYNTEEERLYLNAYFSDVQIKRLLDSAGLPLWSENRPPVLVWVAVDDGTGKRFVKPETHPAVVAVIKGQAQRRGVPLTFPLLDSTDTFSLTPNDLWQMNIALIEQASQRYRPTSILVGRLSARGEGDWVAEWAYLLDGVSNRIASARDQNFAAAVMDLAANQLAAKFAIVTGADAGRSVLVELQGVTGFGDYADAVTYLEGVTGIEHANMVYQSGSKLVLKMALSSSLEKVEQFFALDRKLAVLEANTVAAAPVWQPDAATQAVIAELIGEPLPEMGLEGNGSAAQTAVESGIDLAPEGPAPPPQAERVYQWLGSRS